MDEALQRTRQERDIAQGQASEWQSKHDQVHNEHAALQNAHQALFENSARIQEELQSVKRDRDDAYSEAARLDEENAGLKRKLAEVEGLVASIQERFHQAPKPVEVNPSNGLEQPRDEFGRFDEMPKTSTGGQW
jgi:uncharacterized coiled-coil DUF342 family protein